MSLNLFGPTALGRGVVAPYGAGGGTGPYIWSIQSGLGSIDSDGVYTAPDALSYVPAQNLTVIKAVDSSMPTPASGTLTIRNLDPIGLVCDIIANQLRLAVDQVYFYNQKINVPNDGRLYVAIGINNVKPFGNVNRFDKNTDNSVQWISCQASLSINIISRTIEALYRKEEVPMALFSDYSSAQQELNAFRIARLTSQFVNLSEVDGAAIPYRFNISANLQYATLKSQSVPYFDSFQTPQITVEP